MDAELQALDRAIASSAAQGLQITLLDQIDGVWNAIASDKIDGDPIASGIGETRTDALLSLITVLESRD